MSSSFGRRWDIERLCRHCPEHHDELVASTVELSVDMLHLLDRMSITNPGEHEGPVLKQLHNWLVDPNRTIDGLKSAEGPLWQKEFDNLGYPSGPTICLGGLTIEVSLYLWVVSIEALAARRPILQGPWEYAARSIVKFRKTYRYLIDHEPNYLISDQLNIWLIRMMGDCELCPSPYLQLEFMDIFGDFGIVNPFLESRAFDAFMFASWHLQRDHMKAFLYNKNNNVSLRSIKVSFNKISAEYFQIYDNKLAGKLLFQTTHTLNDFSCSYGFNQNRNTYTYEVNILTALFDTISEHALKILEDVRLFINHSYIYDVTDTLSMIVTAFKKSTETPQLVDVTASCIMDVVEMAVEYNISFINYLYKVDDRCLSSIEKTLWILYGVNANKNIENSPVGQVLNHKYQGRLSNIRHKIKCEELSISAYPMIWNLLYHN